MESTVNYRSKNQLQEYTQKNKLEIPEYLFERSNDNKFICTVKFGGGEYKGKEWRKKKKDVSNKH
jgi:dsRNA-specific ribonuclease